MARLRTIRERLPMSTIPRNWVPILGRTGRNVDQFGTSENTTSTVHLRNPAANAGEEWEYQRAKLSFTGYHRTGTKRPAYQFDRSQGSSGMAILVPFLNLSSIF
jgi:hypothetical protein